MRSRSSSPAASLSSARSRSQASCNRRRMPDAATTQLLERLEAAVDPERLVLDLTLEALAQTDPDFEHFVRRCALPHRLDAEVAELLSRDLPDADPVRLLERVRGLTFVLRRGDGDLAFHDTVRELMTAEWRTDGA